MQRQKMTKCIDRQMQLRFFLAFGAVVGASGTALGRRAQRSAVDGRGGLRGPFGRKAQNVVQVLGHGFKATRSQPPLAC